MGTSFEKALSDLPEKSRKQVQKQAKKEIEYYKSLQSFRKSIGLTQEQVAGQLNLKQTNISQLESRKDMHISTLRKYVEALGGELEITINMPDRGTIHLDKF